MPATQQPVLCARGLTKSYGAIVVLCGVDLQLLPGEVVAIVGASGSGKSTLLHILGTLDQPNSGSLTLGGKDALTLQQADRARLRNEFLGFVFQAHHLLPDFTAEENVALPAWLGGATQRMGLARSRELLAAMGLSQRLQHKPAALSGGEQQRVAIARALINNPQIVFADEPTGSLDAERATQLHALLQQMCRERKQACVIVTHNPQLAALADKVFTLQQGVLQQKEG